MNKFKRTAFAAIFGVAALGLAGGAQAAFVPGTFTVNETLLGLGTNLEGNGGSGYVFEADGVGGNYNELLTLAPDSTFVATASWRANVFTLDQATVNSNVLATTGDGTRGYGLYVLFDANGVLSPGGFTADTGTLSIWLDPDRDTALDFASNDAADGVTQTQNGADILVGTSSFLRQGDGFFTPGLLNEGSFALLFDDFALTAPGGQYFVDPTPFFEMLRVTGQFDTSNNLVAGTDSSSFLITNSSANGTFGNDVEVPTPGLVSLFGIGLLSFGVVARRRKAVKS